MHCFLFWGGDVVQAYKRARVGQSNDRHHAYVNKHYKESPWWWFVIILVVSFVLGLIVVLKEDITLSAWAYVVALLLGCFIAPLVSLSLSFSVVRKKNRTTRPTNDDVQSTILYSRFGNGIATNNLSKMLAGLLVPGRPVGNMYFAVSFATYLSGYCLQRKPPLTMLLLGMVPQRDQQHSQLVERLENGRLS